MTGRSRRRSLRLAALAVLPVLVAAPLLTGLPHATTQRTTVRAAAGTTAGTTAQSATAPDSTDAAHAARAARPAAATRPAVQASRSSARAADDDPLTMTLDSMEPSVIPASGPITLSGTITNDSDETWTTVNIYPLISSTPLTGVSALDAAAETDPDTVVGERITDATRPESFHTVDRLDPGESAAYTVRIPHDLLEQAIAPATPGVYWIGVQALGADASGRDEFADGRARTFIPLLNARPSTTRLAIVVPVRRGVSYDRDGALRGIPGWTRDLGPDGRLTELADLGTAAPAGDLTWLVDPAVLDAVRRLGDGNPARDLDSTSGSSSSPTATATGTGTASATADAAGTTPVVSDDLRARAQQWLTQMQMVARRDTVLGLPYGDVDVAAATGLDPTALAKATALSATTFASLGITARPMVADPSGYLSSASVAGTAPSTAILASSAAVAPSALTAAQSGATTVSVDDRPVDLYDAAASSGGPAPGDATSPLALGQRLVAEAAVRALRQQSQALVVSLPDDWNPGSGAAGLIDALAQPWVDLVGQPVVGAGTSAARHVPSIGSDDLVYPEREATAQLPASSFVASDRLRAAGSALQTLLTRTTTVATQVATEALTSTSYAARTDPVRSADRADAARGVIDGTLRMVTISAPPYVTLSSTSGNKFRVDLSNGLDQPVQVRIKPVVDRGLHIGTPGTIAMAGGGSASVLLTTRSGRLGYHQVDLELTTTSGARLGSHADLPIRSSRTGRIIWVILAGGAALLFGAIAARLVRRLRRYRSRARHAA